MKNAINTVKTKLFEISVLLFGLLSTTAGRVFAQEDAPANGGPTQADDLRQGVGIGTPQQVETDLTPIVQNISRTLIVLIGLVSVVMLIIGGFRYAVSAGDAEAVKGAKNTILYAIIGLVVAFLSWAAVNFVIDQLAAPAANGG